jgi:hypothetical protein
MKLEWLQCCFCDEVIEDFMLSHNPFPVSDNRKDRCCIKCNQEIVVPARINGMSEIKEK